MSFNLSYNRYRGGTLVKDLEGDWIVPKSQGFDTRPRNDDRFHTVIQGERVDLLAHKYLGDARLYWVICLYNDIFWMLDEKKLEPGTTLRIPSYNSLIMSLLV